MANVITTSPARSDWSRSWPGRSGDRAKAAVRSMPGLSAVLHVCQLLQPRRSSPVDRSRTPGGPPASVVDRDGHDAHGGHPRASGRGASAWCWIGYRHFDNIHTGVAAATLYLLFPTRAR